MSKDTASMLRLTQAAFSWSKIFARAEGLPRLAAQHYAVFNFAQTPHRSLSNLEKPGVFNVPPLTPTSGSGPSWKTLAGAFFRCFCEKDALMVNPDVQWLLRFAK